MPNEQISIASRVTTKLKFQLSEETGAYIGFVSKNPKTGQYCGVREESPYPKKICVVDKRLATSVMPGTLYDVVMIPMTERNGYVVIEMVPVEFKASVTTSYVPGCIYVVEVSFGNKVIRFDPLNGRQESMRTLDGCRKLLDARIDIKNHDAVMTKFDLAAIEIYEQYQTDLRNGRIKKTKSQASKKA